MSSAGHVLDMIARMKKNRALREKTRSRYQVVKEACLKQYARNPLVHDKNKLSDVEMVQLRSHIRQNLIKEKRRLVFRQVGLLVALTFVLTVVLFYVLK